MENYEIGEPREDGRKTIFEKIGQTFEFMGKDLSNLSEKVKDFAEDYKRTSPLFNEKLREQRAKDIEENPYRRSAAGKGPWSEFTERLPQAVMKIGTDINNAIVNQINDYKEERQKIADRKEFDRGVGAGAAIGESLGQVFNNMKEDSQSQTENQGLRR